MKSIILYANDDDGLDARLSAALRIATACEARLTCVQVTPYESFIMGDPFGGVYALPTVVEHQGERETELRRRIEERLASEPVKWDWLHYEGHPGHVLLERSRLADLVVVNLPEPAGREQRLSLAADLAIHARTPVLALPRLGAEFDCSGPALVAWNGSPESAHALRLAMPLLEKAGSVHVVSISDDRIEMSAEEAGRYLSDHGVAWQPHEWPRNRRDVAGALLDAAQQLDVRFVVAGAYGHSRIRERVLGGVTRDLIAGSHLPLLLAH